MATKKKAAAAKPVAKKEDPKILSQPPQRSSSNRAELGIENLAVRTVKWAVDLGLVDPSVAKDAEKAESKGELIDALEKVAVACAALDYKEQEKKIAGMIQGLARSGD